MQCGPQEAALRQRLQYLRSIAKADQDVSGRIFANSKLKTQNAKLKLKAKNFAFWVVPIKKFFH